MKFSDLLEYIYDDVTVVKSSDSLQYINDVNVMKSFNLL